MIISKYPITTDNVKNVGGKEVILTRMVNHYKALTKVKAKIDNKCPHPHVKKTQHEINRDLNKQEEFRNVRNTYKKVSSVKPYVDSNKPFTYDKKLKNSYNSAKEKYDNMEHIRTLKAMAGRILSIGKMNERKKNKDDPVANPIYFFRNINANDKDHDEAIKLLSLKNLNERLKDINQNEKNKILLGETVYEAIKQKGRNDWKNLKNNKRPKSSTNFNNKNNEFKQVKGYVEYEPDKYIKIHKFNRANTGSKIVANIQKKNNNKNANNYNNSSISSKRQSKWLISKDFPIFEENNELSQEEREQKFINKIREFIITNSLFSDSDFNLLTDKLIEINKKKKGISKERINEIMNEIKEFLDE